MRTLNACGWFWVSYMILMIVLIAGLTVKVLA